MSTKFPGGFITKTYVAPTPSSASGIWTLDQQEQAQQAGIWPFGGPFNFVEDVFSTYLYNGNGATQAINNGIDLSTKGGLVWIKDRDSGAKGHALFDTARGVNLKLQTQSTNGEFSGANQLTAFNTTGFNLGSAGDPNGSGTTYASWTFRKQPKFFDVVTWSGNGASNRQISHALGSVPGCIIIKKTNGATEWVIYHRSLPANGSYLRFTSDAVTGAGGSGVIAGLATSTYFLVGNDDYVNASGGTYVAYVFAHDAGGFGVSGTDNVISCGSYTGNANSDGPIVTLGYEPQFLIIKRVTTAGSNWILVDNMRGFPVSGSDAYLSPNLSDAETTSTLAAPNATGFQIKIAASNINASANEYIYIAIRRGPMKVPTDATKVFKPVAYNGTGATNIKTDPNFPPDLVFGKKRTGGEDVAWLTRLTGTNILASNTTTAESDYGTFGLYNMNNVGYTLGTNTILNGSGSTYVNYVAQRAPSFFDVVCYTGNGGTNDVTHNLGVVPEFLIIKSRSASGSWFNFSAIGSNYANMDLNTTSASAGSYAISTFCSSTQVKVGTGGIGQIIAGSVNANGVTKVMHLFATCAGVSKVGSYTGNGTTQAVPCGFIGGARFVLIKQTSGAGGDWYVYDTARGMSTLTDPYLLMNTTGAETATLGSVTTTTGGFTVDATILAAINTNAASYIFLAIA